MLRAAKHNKDEIETTDSFRILHLMIAGNVYQTEKHISYCFDEGTGKYNFKDELKYIQPLLGLGDVTVANLRTSFGGDIKNMFSAPDEFALQLKYAGINAAMHANLHTANVSKSTLKRTRQLLNSYDMYHTGSFTDNNQRNGNYPLIINKKGFRLAILNYTSLLTRPSVSRDFIINEFDKTIIERDLRLARANQPDFIIVYFDWGNKDQAMPNQQQMDLAQFVFQRGASIVVGTNPNAPMRIDLINYFDNGQLREGICAYSLGNLIASNDEVNNRNGFLLDIELKKNNYTHATGINDWGVIPVYTHYDTTTVKGQMKVFSVPCWAVENGEILKNIPYIEKRRAANSAYEIRKLVGAVADEIQYNLNELIVNNVQETIDITNAPINNKFSVAREEDVEPTEPPVLPVATIGSNNPPSLAILYEDPSKKTGNPNYKPLVVEQNLSADEMAARKEAQRTNNVSTILAATSSAATVASLAGVKKATAITTEENKVAAKASAAVNKEETTTASKEQKSMTTTVKETSPSNVSLADTIFQLQETGATSNGANSQNKEIVAAGYNNSLSGSADKKAATTNTVTKTQEQNTIAGTSAGKPAAGNAASSDPVKNSSNEAQGNAMDKGKTENLASNTEEEEMKRKKTDDNEAVKEADKNKATTQGNSTDKAKANIAAIADSEEEARRKKAVNSDYAVTGKNQTANTNYRSTGKEYHVDMPTYADRTKPRQTTITENREKVEGIDVSSKNTQGISTGISGGIQADMAPQKQVNMKVVTDTFYRIQFYALKKFIPLDTNYYTHLKGYEVREEDGLFKYLLGKYKTYEECEKLWKGQIQPRYKQSFIIKYVDGKRILE